LKQRAERARAANIAKREAFHTGRLQNHAFREVLRPRRAENIAFRGVFTPGGSQNHAFREVFRARRLPRRRVLRGFWCVALARRGEGIALPSRCCAIPGGVR